MKITRYLDTFDQEFAEILEASGNSYERLRIKYSVAEVKGIYFIEANGERFLIYEADLRRVLNEWRRAGE